MIRSRLIPSLLLLTFLSQGIASRDVKPAARAAYSGRPWKSTFTDISKAAGLTHPAIYGGETKIDYLVETSSGGIAFLDYDQDGYLDIFVTTGTRFGPNPPESTQRLYRNQRDGTFTDVTQAAKLTRSGWQSGVAVADFDGDQYPDLLVTSWGPLALWRNRRDGTFEDISEATGLSKLGNRWWSGASFVDYDRDGDLDLFLGVYVDPFDPGKIPKPGANPNCSWKGLAVACGPRGLSPGSPRLLRNDKGRFTDVSAAAGLGASRCFGMTAAALDLTGDGWPDLYLACDSTPSLLYVNQRNSKFQEQGLEMGVALNEDGREQAGMGLAFGDYNGDGRIDIFKTHFADDTHILYRNDGAGFSEATVAVGLAVETRYVGWGAVFADFDNDGWPDLFYVNGNVYPETEKELPAYPYLSPPMLFRNLDGKRFEQIPPEIGGKALSSMSSSRGLAAGDFDNDGDIDLVIWNRNAPPTLLRNDLKDGGNWLQVAAPLGTRVTALFAGRRHAQEVMSQASFYSANSPVLHFGLGASKTVDLEIRWPDGTIMRRAAVAVNRKLTLSAIP